MTIVRSSTGSEAKFFLITKAADFAKIAFQGQTHRDGQPAYLHSERVAASLEDPLDIVVGYLHDLCEDTQVTLAQLYQEFGMEVSQPVFLLTRPKGLPWNVYLRRIVMEVIDPLGVEHHLRAARVKIKDIEDNLARMDEKMAANSRNGDMYREAIPVLQTFIESATPSTNVAA